MATDNLYVQYNIYKSDYDNAYKSLSESTDVTIEFRTLLAKKYVQIPPYQKTPDAGKWVGDVWRDEVFKFVKKGGKWDIVATVTVITDTEVPKD